MGNTKFICNGPRGKGGVREGCGFDLTTLIERIPFDDKVYSYTCPKCGNAGTARRAASVSGEV